MVPRNDTGKTGPARYSLLAAGLLLAGFWGAPGMAATGSMVECSGISGQLSDDGNDRNPLSFEVVDHIAAIDAVTPGDDLEPAPEVSEAPAPVLYLTPRVASILRDVFGSDIDGVPASDESQAEDRITDKAASVERKNGAVAPIADSADRTDSSDASDSDEITAPMSLIEQSEEVRRFQQQMYRTDI